MIPVFWHERPGCGGLTYVILLQLTKIGPLFLAFSAVEELLLPPHLQEIGDKFLKGSRITSLDLSGTEIRIIPDSFLSQTSMKALCLPVNVGSSFLSDAKIEELPPFPASLEEVGVAFLEGCTTERVDLSQTSLTILPDDFLSHAVGVRALALPPRPKDIGSGFLEAADIGEVPLLPRSI